MAIHNLDENLRLGPDTPWDQKTGQQVEDFITRNIINEGSYGEDEILRLNKLGGDVIEIPVSVVQPTYDYAICLYGLRINGVVYKDPSLVMQYKKDTKVELGIGIRSIMDRNGTIKNYNTTFKVDIEFNNQFLSKQVRNIDHSYFELQGGNYVLGAHEDLEEVLIWEDVTKLFTKVAKNKKISASFKPADLKLENELNTNITNEILNLTYNGNVIVNTNQLQLTFESSQINIADYQLVYYINGQGDGSNPYKLGAGEFIISNLTPGLNQVVVRAENYQNSSICSDWLNFNIIYTKDFTGTAVAVNGVNNGITNNGVATLYKLIIYSTDREEFEFTTYLENAEPSENPNPTQIIKQEYITAYSYNRETNATEEYTYKKYIELENTGSLQYLLIKVKDQFYTFYKGNYSNISGKYSVYSSPYIEMEVEECISEYTYIKSYPISYNFDQITGQANNLFITETQSSSKATLIADLESSDGWKEQDGLTYLKLSKQGKSVLKNPINLNLNDNFSIEMGFRTYNVSDKNQTILTLGKLGLYPTQLGWMYEDLKSEAFLKRNSQFQEGQNTHIVITVAKNWNINNSVYYPDYLGEVQNAFDEKAKQVSYNLVRIYINGCIDREFILNDVSDLNTLKNSLLDIHPKSSDIDLYLFRVYNTHALTHEDVVRNYISYIPEKTGKLSKESVYSKNDILDDTGKISWTKCIGKQNTLLFIYHTGGKFPNRFWGQEDNESSNDVNKKIPCTLIINYADPVINAKYGGVLDKLQCKGQGSSAMRYLIWNVNSSLNKFKYNDAQGEEQKANSKFLPYSNLLNRDNRTDLLPENTNIDEVISKYYPMPPYENEQDTTTYKYKKMVGKVNFASSMQSHKIGACKLYDDAYKKSLGTASLPSGGKKAVHEEPFMYFYIETDEPFNSDYSSELDIDSITYAKILELGDQAKFMGFQTWGPGKGDDACSGYDEDNTPEYLMLEGGENTDASVNFLRPWQALQRLRTDFVRSGAKYNYTTDLKAVPTVTKDQSLAEPWAQLLIDDESIVYTDRGAWDIDYGFVEDEVGETKYFDFAEGAKVSLAKFRNFYDMVYTYDFTFVRVDSTITSPQPDWNVYKKYLVASNTFSINGVAVNGHQGGDVYRYDEPSSSWVRAGVYYNNGWERLNYRQLIEAETGEIAQTETQIKDILKALFIQKVKEFVNLEDFAFHQAFVKFLSGTDNRAKNTYFQIIGNTIDGKGDYKIRLIGDDLDTILVTDNSGLQSKPYNLIEDSYDKSFEETWGDAGNIFFRMFDLSFEQEIKVQLKNIMDFAGLQSSGVNLQSGYFYKVFFKVQEDFPQIAYNHTASIYYENAYIIKNCGASYGFEYTHNNVDPIAQSHGSCLECEKQFMKERIDFLAGYAKSCLGNSLETSSAGAGGQKLKLLLEFEPFQDFYPTYYYDGKIPNIGIYNDSEYDIIKYKAVAGNTYLQTIREEATAINQMLYQMNLYKTLSITGLLVDNLNANFATTTDLTIDNNLIDSNADLFEETYPKVAFAEFTPDFPVLENLNLVSVSLPKELNLSKFYKLQNINLSNSIVESVIFPQTSVLTTITLPESIKTFELYNNPNLKTITFEGYDNIETVYIDCAKCGDFDIANFCENLYVLKSITLKNINNIYLTEETLKKLISCDCNLTGEITIIDTIGSTTPKEISFETKQILVNTFGNIDNGSNGLKINYKSSSEIIVEYPEEVDAYYNTTVGGVQDKGNPFNFNIIGNRVNIIEGKNPVNPDIDYRLDIKYSLVLGNSSEVELDEISGNLTIKTNPTVTTTVRITINGNLYNTTPIKINFKWNTPQLGQFVYSDGTFSFNYISSKDLIGIIYDKTGSDDDGTIYVLGTEFTNDKEYTSYITTDNNNSTTGIHAQVNQFVANCRNLFGDDITVNNPTQFNIPNNINKTDGETIKELKSNGYEETELYVNFVNTTILPKLHSKYPNFITKDISEGSTQYRITSIDNLNGLCKVLVEDNITSVLDIAVDFNASILHPYFYSAWLYKPKNSGIYSDQQWYAPSANDWAKIIYLYGYSIALDNFSEANSARIFDTELSTNVSGSNYTDNFVNIPLFALAKSKLTSKYPEAWDRLAIGTNKITTSKNDVSNYGYVQIQNWNSSSSGWNYYAEWQAGLYQTEWSTQKEDLWGYTKRQGGLPFTKIEYKNPQLQ